MEGMNHFDGEFFLELITSMNFMALSVCAMGIESKIIVKFVYSKLG